MDDALRLIFASASDEIYSNHSSYGVIHDDLEYTYDILYSYHYILYSVITVQNIYMYVHVCMYVYTYACTCTTQTYKHIRTVHTHMCTDTYMHARTHAHARTHTHAHTHTHTHTHTHFSHLSTWLIFHNNVFLLPVTKKSIFPSTKQ